MQTDDKPSGDGTIAADGPSPEPGPPSGELAAARSPGPGITASGQEEKAVAPAAGDADVVAEEPEETIEPLLTASGARVRVLVAYNLVGDDEYAPLREIDPTTLDFVPEYPIDVATAEEEYTGVVGALGQAGFETTALNLEDDIERLHDRLRDDPPDVVFNLVEIFRDRPGLEAAIAALYELYGVPYTGAPPFALTLCQRKGLTKQLLRENGVRTPRYKLLSDARVPRRHGLRYPLIVKPGLEDASAGVFPESVVDNLDALLARVQKVFDDHGPPILVEEYIDGRELHVSVIGNDPPEVLPPVEYDFSDLPPEHPNVISFDIKWNPLKEAYHRVHEVCPTSLPPALERRVRRVALESFRIARCRDYARVDMRITSDNRIYVLEVNPNPDLTEGVSFMRAAEVAGGSFARTLHRLVACALARRPEPPPAQVVPSTQPTAPTVPPTEPPRQPEPAPATPVRSETPHE